MVSRSEFGRAIPALGIEAPDAAVDALFDSFDPDGSGSIEYAEFNKLLRKPAKEEPPEPLWKGPLLGPRSLIFVFAPNSSDRFRLLNTHSVHLLICIRHRPPGL